MPMSMKQSYLMERLNSWRNDQLDALGGRYASTIPGVTPPKGVRDAKSRIQRDSRIVAAWDRRQQQIRKTKEEIINKVWALAREVVLFQPPDAALAFVKKMTKGRKR